MKTILAIALLAITISGQALSAPQLEYCGKAKYDAYYGQRFDGKSANGTSNIVKGFIIPLNSEVIDALPSKDEGEVEVCVKGTAWRENPSWTKLMIFEVIRK